MITETWYINIDDHDNCEHIFGFEKGFDAVVHDLLLSKLSAFGKTYGWFKTYLENRKQFCYVERQKSSTKRIDCGIPQGLCLGPLLFVIYTNDFGRCLEGTAPNMYTDDTSTTCSSNDSASLQRNVDIEMANVAEWTRQNGLSVNANKSEFMVKIHSRQHNSLNELNESEVNQEKIARYYVWDVFSIFSNQCGLGYE